MKVVFLEQFEKDLDALDDRAIKDALYKAIVAIESAARLQDLPNVKKLKGFKNVYRIRVRDYRIGFMLDRGVVHLARVLNRKDIYRLFP